MSERKVTPNPSLFRELSAPFDDMPQANAAVDAFFEGVKALREQHGIANVYVVINDAVIDSDGSEQEVMTTAMWGDHLRGEMMAAWALGQEQQMRQERIAGLLRKAFNKGPRER